MLDAEDLLEEIDYELSKTQVETESQSATNKVWISLRSSFFSFFENEIKSMMEQVIEDLEHLATQSGFLGLKKGSGGVGSGSGSKLAYTSLPNESVIYGRDDDKEFVFNWLTSDTDNKLSILSMVGWLRPHLPNMYSMTQGLKLNLILKLGSVFHRNLMFSMYLEQFLTQLLVQLNVVCNRK